MAKKLGDNIRLFVAPAAGEVFLQPLGQGNLTINRSDSSIDTSDKNTGRYATSAPGQSTLTLTQAIQPNLPDVAFTRLKTLDAGRETAVFQAIDITDGDAPGAVQFECLMYIVFGNTDAAQKGVVSSTITLSAAEAPTIDLI